MHRVVFPIEGNLYGRSISPTPPPHRFLPGSKGGLYCWNQVRRYPEVILVEGLFDYAVLWQACFQNVTCAMGSHLNAHQLRQLCDSPRTVYLAFDADTNGSGQHAAQRLWRTLREGGIGARLVSQPDGHDQTPSSSRAEPHGSFNLFWRQLRDDLSSDLPAWLQPRTKFDPHCRTARGPRSRLGQSVSGPRIRPPPGRHYTAHLCA